MKHQSNTIVSTLNLVKKIFRFVPGTIDHKMFQMSISEYNHVVKYSSQKANINQY